MRETNGEPHLSGRRSLRLRSPISPVAHLSGRPSLRSPTARSPLAVPRDEPPASAANASPRAWWRCAARRLSGAHGRLLHRGRQLERAATSVTLDIAEPGGRAGRDRVRVLRIATGEAREVRTVLAVAGAWGYVDTAEVARGRLLTNGDGEPTSSLARGRGLSAFDTPSLAL
ncbi:MAG: four helix bundle protein, partial [Myxococcales bacterium]|nr:four helix bundle protein [Myxococcales bacterium]